MRIACIGSRSVSEEQKDLFINIGKFIVSGGDFISSGNADGSDSFFAMGGNSVKPENVIIYLPWKNYNTYYLNNKNKICYEPKKEWFLETAPHHPNFDKLTQGVKRLMARNYGILHRADKCIALLNHKKPGGGGTGQGWRIAEHLNIPRLDLNNKSFDEVVEFLES